MYYSKCTYYWKLTQNVNFLQDMGVVSTFPNLADSRFITRDFQNYQTWPLAEDRISLSIAFFTF